jgi:DNA-directed RNA polymerase subunit F
MERIEEKPITLTEAREILMKRKSEGELKSGQKICLEYLNKMPKLQKNKVEKLKEELGALNLLKPNKIVELINIMPTTKEEVSLILEKENLKKEEIEKIVEIISNYVK